LFTGAKFVVKLVVVVSRLYWNDESGCPVCIQ